jgi:hypothetical protein
MFVSGVTTRWQDAVEKTLTLRVEIEEGVLLAGQTQIRTPPEARSTVDNRPVHKDKDPAANCQAERRHKHNESGT